MFLKKMAFCFAVAVTSVMALNVSKADAAIDTNVTNNAFCATDSAIGITEAATTDNAGIRVTESNNSQVVKVNSKAGQASSVKKAKAGQAGSVKKAKKKPSYTKAELRLMSSIIFCEANIEPYAGKLAVGIVVMNRVASKDFANSVKGVIYERGQFSPVRNGALKRALARYDAGKFTSKNEKQCIKAAKLALEGEKTVTLSGGKRLNMKSYHFFSVYLRGARLKIKGHRFK
ncbi:MAG: cell wall hydrolase [Lachnospiraceae bacterium]|nr:cell wall hydrolase [Lachnoclostridium sp.]MDY2599715.1 cell wall hydrolase [Lachnospiraceae bacterium]